MSNFFWTDSRLEPKRGYRFLVTIGEMPNGAVYYVKSVTKNICILVTSFIIQV
jgi:hypothetical protein